MEQELLPGFEGEPLDSRSFPRGRVRNGMAASFPSGWIRQSLVTAVGGNRFVIGGPFGSNLTQADYVSAGVPVIRGANMNRNGRFIGGEFVFVSNNKAQELSSNIARPGDIVVTQRGTVGQVSIIPKGLGFENFVVSQSQMAITVDDSIERDFLYIYLSSSMFEKYIQISTNQTGVPHITLQLLRKTPLVVPPLSEQRRIADILATWDQAVDATNNLLEKEIKIYRTWLEDAIVAHSGNVFEFGEIALNTNELAGNGVKSRLLPCIELEHISERSGEIISHGSWDEKLSIKRIFRKGDVLYGRLRPYLRKYAHPDFDGVCSTEIWALQPRGNLCTPEYLFVLVQSEHFAAAANKSAGSKMPRAEWDAVSAQPFRLPPLATQNRIGHEIAILRRRQTLLRLKAANLRRQRDALATELLTGRLRVPEAERLSAAAG